MVDGIDTHIKILTLNCWGIPLPIACKFRKERIAAIATELSKGEFDIVFLQEIWSQEDYEAISKRISSTMPFTHYFDSGLIGSGVCILSKGPILETFFHQFSLNGYFHKFHHGDWLGGKGVGLCRIRYKGLKINLYGTHIHAEYCRDNDEYLAHRVSQAFEMSQFIKLTSNSGDISIIGGDFNLEADDLGCKLIVCNGQLSDAWLEKKTTNAGDSGMTCDTPSNSFVDKKCLKHWPNGKRIDYIMYRTGAEVEVECERCYTTMGIVPNEGYNYSDHEGVAAELKIRKTSFEAGHASPFTMSSIDVKGSNVQLMKSLLTNSIDIIDQRLQSYSKDQVWYLFVIFITCFLLFLFSLTSPTMYYYVACLALGRLILQVILSYCVFMGILWMVMERKSLISTKKNMMNLLNNYNIG